MSECGGESEYDDGLDDELMDQDEAANLVGDAMIPRETWQNSEDLGGGHLMNENEAVDLCGDAMTPRPAAQQQDEDYDDHGDLGDHEGHGDDGDDDDHQDQDQDQKMTTDHDEDGEDEQPIPEGYIFESDWQHDPNAYDHIVMRADPRDRRPLVREVNLVLPTSIRLQGIRTYHSLPLAHIREVYKDPTASPGLNVISLKVLQFEGYSYSIEQGNYGRDMWIKDPSGKIIAKGRQSHGEKDFVLTEDRKSPRKLCWDRRYPQPLPPLPEADVSEGDVLEEDVQ